MDTPSGKDTRRGESLFAYRRSSAKCQWARTGFQPDPSRAVVIHTGGMPSEHAVVMLEYTQTAKGEIEILRRQRGREYPARGRMWLGQIVIPMGMRLRRRRSAAEGASYMAVATKLNRDHLSGDEELHTGRLVPARCGCQFYSLAALVKL